MTDYVNDFKMLSGEFDLNVSCKNVEIDGHKVFEMLSIPFISTADFVYPKGSDYSKLNSTCKSLLKFYCKNNKYSNDYIFRHLEAADRDILENKKFRIPIIKPYGNKKYKKAIFLMHGLNEKHWYKYLPWGLRLMEETEAPVILFPTAFHMNRAPESWANPREMMRVATERKNLVDKNSETSFVNAALSYRLQFVPHRFFCSGIQTYYDVLSFLNETKIGSHPFLDKDCKFNFFSYSIGATLTEVLMNSNYNNYFDNSKAFLFCGGATLDMANPICKTIMDADAHTELFKWLGTLFNSTTETSHKFKEIFFKSLPEVLNFKSLLFYDKMKTFRENALKKKSCDIFGMSLLKDTVFSHHAVEKTLNGFNNDIKIKTEVLDFPFDYKHEDPFPVIESNRKKINTAFEEVFSKAAEFITK